ncbi:hypothetical protein [Sphingomonas sp. TREG-RG-20F-R18-01]|uniref:hypothetical protein n=1 Tax=Sphingomonas sp. TREG-RG-20F-R18-01 TaxID=2914982 RepID=UPI001F57751C|nr:hypothetical protein [Sphingomonas sp. TREG-RG-20F-R18-01]
MSSAMVEEPPSPAKLALIRRFLIANGTQSDIDTGNFLQRFALPGSPLSMVAADASGDITFRQSWDLPLKALMAAYDKHRHTWQDEYETHVNWEFEEEELSLIVAFLESAVGQHFLEGRWRMGAYVGSNTEDLVEQVLADAEAVLREGVAHRPAQ